MNIKFQRAELNSIFLKLNHKYFADWNDYSTEMWKG